MDRLSTKSIFEKELLSVQAIDDEKNVIVWSPTSFGNILHFQVLPFVIDNKLGLVDTEIRFLPLII